MELSNLAKGMGGSVIREMFNEALKMENTIKFTVGEPDFVTPKAIIDRACEYWQNGLTHYTPNMGVKALREAIADYHKDDLSPDPDSQIMVSCGATEGLQMAIFALANPGDEIILVTPAWPNYFGMIAMAGAKLVMVEAREENNYVPDVEDIKKAITDKTKLIILNSPSNPTGAVIDKETLKELADLIVKNDIWVISDEIYSRLVYDNEEYTSITSFEGIKERCVYVSGFSKMFAMTGWRLGYAIAAPEVIKSMTKIHENGASCLPEPSQLAAAFALMNCQAEVEEMRKSYERRRNLICGLINETPGLSIKVPKGAFYAFTNAKKLCAATGLDTKALCMDILHKTGVVMVPGSGFGTGGDGYIRITYATSDENIVEGLRRLKEYTEKVM